MSVEDFVELPQQVEIDAAVKLHGVQSALLRDVCDLLGCKSREDSDAFDCCPADAV